MRNAVVLGYETSDCIDLILHQGNERRYHYGCAFHDEGRKLIAEGFSSAGRHEYKGVVSVNKVSYNILLIGFE